MTQGRFFEIAALHDVGYGVRDGGGSGAVVRALQLAALNRNGFLRRSLSRHWRLPHLSARSRDRLPNPEMDEGHGYIPADGPAIGDLTRLFEFGADRGDDASER